jgi:hypothetical protein
MACVMDGISGLLSGGGILGDGRMGDTREESDRGGPMIELKGYALGSQFEGCYFFLLQGDRRLHWGMLVIAGRAVLG